jgi:Protein of unknown function (DUF2934)
MARTKSPAGSKANRANNTDKEQPGVLVPGLGPPGSAADVKSAVREAAAVAAASQTNAKPEPRKFEVVKNESRRNLVPINLEDEIRQRAYELYEQRGATGGNEAEDWFNAEREIKQRYHQQSA